MLSTSLLNEVKILEDRLLADFITEFPEKPTLEEVISVNAYLVMAHGCIEEHVETVFQQHADGMDCGDDQLSVARAVASAVHAWNEAAKDKPYRERRLGDVLKAGSSYMTKAAQKNNGIKENNVLALARAAGVEWPPFESACNDALIKLETLGGKRGEVAHVSASRSLFASSPIYPPDAKAWVKDAIDAALQIEAYLTVSRSAGVDVGPAGATT